jgi:hypothetical protein
MTQSKPLLGSPIPRREMKSLRAYVDFGSHKEAAKALQITEITQRQRCQRVLRRTGYKSAAQAAWMLHDVLKAAA